MEIVLGTRPESTTSSGAFEHRSARRAGPLASTTYLLHVHHWTYQERALPDVHTHAHTSEVQTDQGKEWKRDIYVSGRLHNLPYYITTSRLEKQGHFLVKYEKIVFF